MITLSPEEKEYIKVVLKPLLQKNNMGKVRNKLQSDKKSNIFAFLLENDIDVFSDTDEIQSASDLYKELTRIHIPSHIKTIANDAFFNCDKLENITFEKGVETIGTAAFAGSNIKSIKLPRTIKRIGKNAFANCNNLKMVILPDTFTKLSEGIFNLTPGDLIVYTNSRKDLPIEKQLRCPESDVDWYKKHLRVNKDYLYEKYNLTEAWSESTPNWLKPRLNTLAKYFDRFNYRGEPVDDYVYKRPRDADWHERKDLYGILRDKGIDFEAIEFIEGEVPQSNGDARMKLPNVGVWHFPNGQVYMLGINDLEKYADVSSKYYDKNFGSVPFKMLKEEADAFCYFNIDEAGKKDYGALKTSRDEWRDWLRNPENKYAKLSDIEQKKDVDPGRRDVFDKSGFRSVPSAKKYADILRKMHAKDYAKDLENYEQRLKKCFMTIQQDILDDFNWDDDDLYDVVRSATSGYQQSVRGYKNLLRKVKELQDNYYGDEDGFLSAIADDGWGTFQYYKRDVESDIRSTEEALKKYKKVYIDF